MSAQYSPPQLAMLPSTKLGLPLSENDSCTAVCFTSLAPYDAPQSPQALSMMIDEGPTVPAFSYLGWFGSKAKGVIEISAVRNTVQGTLLGSAFTQATVKLPDAASIPRNVIHALVPCISTRQRSSDGRLCHVPMVACVVSAAAAADSSSSADLPRAGVVFVQVPAAAAAVADDADVAAAATTASPSLVVANERERAFYEWFEADLLQQRGGLAAAAPPSSSSQSTTTATSSFLALPPLSFVSREASGTNEDVTLWLPELHALIVGCDNGRVFSVAPTTKHASSAQSMTLRQQQQQHTHLLVQDDAAGPIVQVAVCVSSSPSSSSVIVAAWNKCYIIDLKDATMVAATRVVGTKQRVGPYGASSLLPMASAFDSCRLGGGGGGAPLDEGLPPHVTLALRPNRINLVDASTGQVPQQLLWPASPKVPGVRSIRDATALVDRVVFASTLAAAAPAPASEDDGNEDGANVPSKKLPVCVVLCIARNQVAVMDLFGRNFLAVQQLTAEVLSALQESCKDDDGSAAAAGGGGVGGGGGAGALLSARDDDMSARASAVPSARRVSARQNAAASAIDLALTAQGPWNVRSVHVLLGCFLVVLLRNGEVNVLTLGDVRGEFVRGVLLPPSPVAASSTSDHDATDRDAAEEDDDSHDQQQHSLQEAADDGNNETTPAHDGEKSSEIEQQQQNAANGSEAVETGVALEPTGDACMTLQQEEREDDAERCAAAAAVAAASSSSSPSPPSPVPEPPEQRKKHSHEEQQQQQQQQQQQHEQEQQQPVAATAPTPAPAKIKRDDLASWIDTVELEVLQVLAGTVAISSSLSTSGGSSQAPTLTSRDFFSKFLDIVVRLCARVRSTGNPQPPPSPSASTDDLTAEALQQQQYPYVDMISRASDVAALCRRFSKLLPDLFRYAQSELQKPLTERRPDANLFLKEEVKRRIASLVLVPLCFFEYSSLFESFAAAGSMGMAAAAAAAAAADASSSAGGVRNNSLGGGGGLAASAPSDPRLMYTRGESLLAPRSDSASPLGVAASGDQRSSTGGGGGGSGGNSIEGPEDVAFATAARSTFKLLRSLRLMSWSVAAALIYMLHRRRSLSNATFLMDAFRSLSDQQQQQQQQQQQHVDPMEPPQVSSSSVRIAGEALRRRPLPGCEPLITRSSKHQPLPNLLSCAMLIARRVVRPGVPFFGACVADAQDDAAEINAYVQQQRQGVPLSSNSSSPVVTYAPPPRAGTTLGSDFDFERLARNVENCILSGDARISDYFPPLPDLLSGQSSTTSSFLLSRNAQAMSTAKKAAAAAADEEDAMESGNYNGNGTAAGGDAAAAREEARKAEKAAIHAALNIFEACCSEPDAFFIDYAVHTVLTMVYLPFLNLTLPTKANIVAASQLAWDAAFDQQWVEWAITCPRLREEAHAFLTKNMKTGAPPIQKRLPPGAMMSSVLCDHILQYLVRLHGDPRVNLPLSPILNGGRTAAAGAANGKQQQQQQSSSSSSSAVAASIAQAASFREVDLVLARRFCWCLHVFFFEHAVAFAKYTNSSTSAIYSSGTNSSKSPSPSRGGSPQNSAVLFKPPTSPLSPLGTSPGGGGGKPPTAASSAQLQRRLRQVDMWVEDIVVGLRTFFVSDRDMSGILLRGVAELAGAFHHGKSLVETDGFNRVVDRVVSNGDVSVLLPTLQGMGERLSTREWSYVLLVAKGAGLLRDAVHLALAVENEVAKVRALVIQAFPSLRLSAHSVPSDPQLADALDMLQKLMPQ